MEAMKLGLSKPAIDRINQSFAQITDFDQLKFEQLSLNGLEQLELKDRVLHFIGALNQCLPQDFEQTAAILLKLPPIWQQTAEQYQDSIHPMFAAWPIIDYVAVYGLNHPDISLNVLKTLTPLFSAEFAIRPFIQRYPQLCLSYFNHWVKDDSEHVRRLVSEGTRPLLPWGIRLTQFVDDPTPNLALLNALKADPSLYVRRSVANHLNDIAKHDSDLVMQICSDWYQNADENTLWLIKHACRGLIKAGHSEAFKLLGFTDNPQVKLSQLELSQNTIKTGESLSFNFSINSESAQTQQLVIDYKLYFMRANGKQNGKVFKLKNLTIQPEQSLNINKSHSFKPVTTRKYYPGEHKLEIMVNGVVMQMAEFELV
ncbi:DNA alkylation repair protein [Catenovulum sp. 2E275]|uniref:DNA alkylation repair protein n=1 Tax=Catenovulum sp. 2E275 TaxID=2980497 RepID=UPI0021D0D554|nr:DNA alkylation repair protein [Catenovulum sp. 2E275]MCU4675685.1 DNA alkylation repair protein [Catenovulum sp. 2E275]